ncbi:hypothetical protein D3C81_1754380 [compost metagenome]
MPNLQQHQDDRPILRRGQELDRPKTEHGQDLVNEAPICSHKSGDKHGDDGPRKKVGENHHRLGNFLEPLAAKLGHHDGDAHSGKGIEGNKQHVQKNRVADNPDPVIGLEEKLKVF